LQDSQPLDDQEHLPFYCPVERGDKSIELERENGSRSGESLADKVARRSLEGNYTPIKSLNTFLFDWKIKARVTKKHNKKTWKNNRGQGTLLNVELIDY
jgi:ssDNA-binding replication factor A large subunit